MLLHKIVMYIYALNISRVENGTAIRRGSDETCEFSENTYQQNWDY